MSTVLHQLGMKRKDAEGCPPSYAACPCPNNEYENETVFPCIEAFGPVAQRLPLAAMKPGVRYRTTVELRLKSVSLDENKGATHGSMAVTAIGDLEPQGEEEESKEAVVKVMRAAAAHA